LIQAVAAYGRQQEPGKTRESESNVPRLHDQLDPAGPGVGVGVGVGAGAGAGAGADAVPVVVRLPIAHQPVVP
jgi:hypothetical protein